MDVIIQYTIWPRIGAYKQGGFIRVDGSLGIMSVQGKIAVALKVLLHDIDPRLVKLTPSSPTSAYFVSGVTTTKGAMVGSYPSDVPGAIFVVFQMEPTIKIIFQGLTDNHIAIAFARQKGGMDIGVAIDTSVVSTAGNGERTRSPKAKLDFFKCSKALLQQTIQ